MGHCPTELNEPVSMSLSINRQYGELDRLREANDLNRDGSLPFPARAVSKRRKRHIGQFALLVGGRT